MCGLCFWGSGLGVGFGVWGVRSPGLGFGMVDLGFGDLRFEVWGLGLGTWQVESVVWGCGVWGWMCFLFGIRVLCRGISSVILSMQIGFGIGELALFMVCEA